MGFRLLLSSQVIPLSFHFRLTKGHQWRLCFCHSWLCYCHTWLRSCVRAELVQNLASLLNLRLCMAWDSATFPWDWDAESFHIAGHGSGNDFRKPAGNGRLLETELCVGKNGVSFHCSKESSPVVQPSATSSLAKHDVSHVDWHASRQINGFSRESGPAAPITCASISRHDESNVSWHGSLNINGSAMANTQCMLPNNGMVGHGDVSCMATGVLPIVTTCVGNGNGPFASFNNNSAAHNPGKAAQKGVMDNWKKTEYGLAGCFEQERQQQQPSLMQHAHQQNILSKEKTQLATIKVKEEIGVASTSDSARAHHIDEQHSSNATGSAGSGDSFTGLHLGKRTYSPDVLKATASKSAQKPVLAPKKARTGAAIPRCQVEGCKLDLTTAKDYHRRHKVCEQHSKAEKVVVASAEQRFCQQCSRFHALAEFDEAKRSCRRRLAGHNERRRKPQPDPLALHARLHSAYEDWSFLHQPRFSRMPLLWQESGDYRSGGMWPRTATTLFENHPACDYTVQGPATERQGYMKSLSQQPALSYHDKLSLLLLQSPKSVMPNSTAYPPRVHQYPFEALGGPMGDSLTLAPSSTGAGVLAGLDTTPVTRGVTRVFSDSGRALSLLSLQTRGSQAPDVLMPADPSGLANMLTLNHHQLAHNEDAIVPQHFLLQGGQHQYYHDGSVDKNMVSMALSSSQAQSGGAHLGSMVTFERDLDECAFAHDLNRQTCTHPLFALMPYPQEDDLSQGGHQQEG